MGRLGDEESLEGSILGLWKGRFGRLFQVELGSAFLGRREVLSTVSSGQPTLELRGSMDVSVYATSTHQSQSWGTTSEAAQTTDCPEVTLPPTLVLESGWDQYAFAFNDLALAMAFDGAEVEWSERIHQILREWLASGDRVAQARAAFVCMELAYAAQNHDSGLSAELHRAFLELRDGGTELAANVSLIGLLKSGDPPLQLAAAWALHWMGHSRLPQQPAASDVLLVLQGLWRFGEARLLRRFSAWAFSNQPLLSRDAIPIDAWGDCDQWFETEAAADSSNSDIYETARTVLAWYRRRPWSDAELVDRIRKQVRFGRPDPTQQELLQALGAAESKPDE